LFEDIRHAILAPRHYFQSHYWFSSFSHAIRLPIDAATFNIHEEPSYDIYFHFFALPYYDIHTPFEY
jgi:hypothetical protein